MWNLIATLVLGFARWWDRNPFCIHGPDNSIYLVRYRLTRFSWFRLYVHVINRSDSDRDMHDHPWAFWSLILRGGYMEYTPSKGAGWDPDFYDGRSYSAGSLLRHKATDLHRLQLFPGINPKTNLYDEAFEIPAVTLVWAGKKTRRWGFQTESGWVPFEEYEEFKRRQTCPSEVVPPANTADGTSAKPAGS